MFLTVWETARSTDLRRRTGSPLEETHPPTRFSWSRARPVLTIAAGSPHSRPGKRGIITRILCAIDAPPRPQRLAATAGPQATPLHERDCVSRQVGRDRDPRVPGTEAAGTDPVLLGVRPLLSLALEAVHLRAAGHPAIRGSATITAPHQGRVPGRARLDHDHAPAPSGAARPHRRKHRPSHSLPDDQA